MNKLFFAIILTIPNVVVTAQTPEIPNASFEQWMNHGNYLDPEGWDSDNSSVSTIPGFTNYPVVPVTQTSHGDSAVLLRNRLISMIGATIPGVITNGVFELGSGFEPRIYGGGPVSGRPIALTGDYRYYPASVDCFGISIILTRYNVSENHRDTIAAGVFSGKDTVATYTPFEVDIQYFSSGEPDTMLIIIVSAINDDPVEGTQLFVDNLSFKSGTGWIDHEQRMLHPEVFPNPARDRVYLTRIPPGTTCRIMDETGKILLNTQVDGREKSLPLNGLQDGLYFYELINEAMGSRHTGKLLIIH